MIRRAASWDAAQALASPGGGGGGMGHMGVHDPASLTAPRPFGHLERCGTEDGGLGGGGAASSFSSAVGRPSTRKARRRDPGGPSTAPPALTPVRVQGQHPQGQQQLPVAPSSFAAPAPAPAPAPAGGGGGAGQGRYWTRSKNHPPSAPPNPNRMPSQVPSLFSPGMGGAPTLTPKAVPRLRPKAGAPAAAPAALPAASASASASASADHNQTAATNQLSDSLLPPATFSPPPGAVPPPRTGRRGGGFAPAPFQFEGFPSSVRGPAPAAAAPSHHRRPGPHSPNTSIDTLDNPNDSTVSSMSHHPASSAPLLPGGGPPRERGHRSLPSDETLAYSVGGGDGPQEWLNDQAGHPPPLDQYGGADQARPQPQPAPPPEEDEEIGRTRLDFSTLLSPEPKAGRRGKAAGTAAASAPVPAPVPAPAPAPAPAQTPFSAASFRRAPFGNHLDDAAIGRRIVEGAGAPLTPGAASLRFQLDSTDVSPIPDHHHHSGRPETASAGSSPEGAPRSRSGSASASASAPAELLQTSAVSGVTASSAGDSLTEASGATGGGGRQRKSRPMPDMSAFDGAAGGTMTSSSLLGGDQDAMNVDPSSPHPHPHQQGSAGGQSLPSIPPPSPYKLVCPPTPARTPVWAAHADEEPQTTSKPKRFSLAGAFGPAGSRLARADSLIATKVLAECPPQILDGLSSLESSLMEDADRSGGSGTASAGAGVLQGNSSDLTASLEDEGQRSFGDAKAQQGKSGTKLAPIGETGIASDGMMDYDATEEASPRRNLSQMDEEEILDAAYRRREDTGTARARIGADTGRDEKEMVAHWEDMSSFKARAGSGPGKADENAALQKGPPQRTQSISFNKDFENLGQLGSGAFADVFKVRSNADGMQYAIKKNRRQFRGKRDRDRAMAQVRIMQTLQTSVAQKEDKAKSSYCLYLLFFIRAWQEDGYFFCQTELCSRDTCRQLVESLTSNWGIAKNAYPSLLRNLPSPQGAYLGSADAGGRLVPEPTIWKICHDVCAGLSHLHSCGMVHQDVKPSNLLFVTHSRLGVLCKIGDFGMAGEIGVTEDGEEGDTAYMAPELLETGPRHASVDIFSLGLTIYELASATIGWKLPTDGPRWHELRNGDRAPDLPQGRSAELSGLIHKMITRNANGRPSAASILESVEEVTKAGATVDQFLTEYVQDVNEWDNVREREAALARRKSLERRMTPTPTMSVLWPGSSGMGDRSDSSRSMNVRTPTPDS